MLTNSITYDATLKHGAGVGAWRVVIRGALVGTFANDANAACAALDALLGAGTSDALFASDDADDVDAPTIEGRIYNALFGLIEDVRADALGN